MRPSLEGVLREYIKDDDIVWREGYCLYNGYEIVSLYGYGERKYPAVWVRSAMPDLRNNGWLDASHPEFFKQLDAALIIGKKVIDDTEQDKKVFWEFRKHLGY